MSTDTLSWLLWPSKSRQEFATLVTLPYTGSRFLSAVNGLVRGNVRGWCAGLGPHTRRCEWKIYHIQTSFCYISIAWKPTFNIVCLNAVRWVSSSLSLMLCSVWRQIVFVEQCIQNAIGCEHLDLLLLQTSGMRKMSATTRHSRIRSALHLSSLAIPRHRFSRWSVEKVGRCRIRIYSSDDAFRCQSIAFLGRFVSELHSHKPEMRLEMAKQHWLLVMFCVKSVRTFYIDRSLELKTHKTNAG